MGMMTIWRPGQGETGPPANAVLQACPGDRSGPETRLLTKIHNPEMRSCQERKSRAARAVRGRCTASMPGRP